MWKIEEAVAYYHRQGAPSDQSALIALLREVQQENGGKIPLSVLPQIAEWIDCKESYLIAVIKRIPSLRLSDTHELVLCAGPNCSKRAALAAFVEKTYGRNPKKFTVKYGACMRMCGKGPNIKWDGKTYNGVDETLIRSLIDGI
ncbi:MAG: NAD(P)H-dependent oxidoreductase subunit E [Oscillospiraceae bacterium]|nr:NAD(P)H-dependent oxidoreductase subunit E [Oscillospiraceae bacterium]